MRLNQRLLQLGLCFCAIGIYTTQALTDVVRDGTVGPDSSIQPGGPNFEITEQMGHRRGANLFHSFQEFDVSETQSATFSGSGDVTHIISRVTGAGASNIDGLLRSTIPGAALYLMNPHGIFFGQNAQLDVQGAFHVSTASGLIFESGEILDSDISVPPVLSVSQPDAFGFLGDEAAPIELIGGKLHSVYDIALSGGTVALREGAQVTTSSVYATTGDITLFATEKVSLSGVDSLGNGSGLRTTTDTENPSGGIRVEAPVIDLQDGASLSTRTTGQGHGGLLIVEAGERLTLSGHDGGGNSSRLSTDAAAGGGGARCGLRVG